MDESRNAALYLSAVTSIDAAYVGTVSGGSRLQGLSFKPLVTVEGNVDGDEQVVADFGSIKKKIKEAIDDKLHGYDHKLLYDPKQVSVEPGHLVGTSHLTVADHGMLISGDTRGMRPVHNLGDSQDIPGTICTSLGTYLGVKFPDFRFSVTYDAEAEGIPFSSRLQHHGYACTKPVYFDYMHGLPRSTSWGCQFIAHGHLSFVQLLRDAAGERASLYRDEPEDLELAADIAQSLNNTYIVNRAYYWQAKGTDFIRYTSRDRGVFSLHAAGDNLSLVFLDTETTIENIAAYVERVWRKRLSACGITALYLSEGLQKGCLVRVSS